MRLDKFLKVSRLIKRRTLAKEASEQERILVNDKIAKPSKELKIGDTIKIIKMDGEPQYTDREGVVTHIDDAGQIHGTWGGCAIIPEVDTYIIVKRA